MNVGEVLDGKYELVRCIGGGGMGAVWEGRQIRTDQRVAIKALHEHLMAETDLVTRFLREAKAALESRYSGHIIQLLDVANPPDCPPYLVMEFLEGEDLAQILKKDGPLEITRAVELIIQSCHAVAEVHRQGIIHRDIKPDNLFAVRLPNGSEWIKLLDFGVAKFRVPPDSDERQLTAVGSAVGTPHYMAPEQILSISTLDHRADIYSMGVVAYELLTGQRPYRTGNIAELVTIIARGQPTPPSELRPEVSRDLERVIRRAMALDKENRFESMFELAEELDPFLHGEESRSEPIHAVKTIRTKVDKPDLSEILESTFSFDDYGRTDRHALFTDSDEVSKTSPDRARSRQRPLLQLYSEGSDDEEETRIATPHGQPVVAAPNEAMADSSLGREDRDVDVLATTPPEGTLPPPSHADASGIDSDATTRLPALYVEGEGEDTMLSPVAELPPAIREHYEDTPPEGTSRSSHHDQAGLPNLYEEIGDDDKTIAMIMPEHNDTGRSSLLDSKQNRLVLYVIVGLSMLAVVMSAIIGFFAVSGIEARGVRELPIPDVLRGDAAIEPSSERLPQE
jgi:serine/threonine protein kinase